MVLRHMQVRAHLLSGLVPASLRSLHALTTPGRTSSVSIAAQVLWPDWESALERVLVLQDDTPVTSELLRRIDGLLLRTSCGQPRMHEAQEDLHAFKDALNLQDLHGSFKMWKVHLQQVFPAGRFLPRGEAPIGLGAHAIDAP